MALPRERCGGYDGCCGGGGGKAAGPSAAGSVQALLTQEPAPLSLADALWELPPRAAPFIPPQRHRA